MGLCPSRSEETSLDEEVQEQLRLWNAEERQIVKILILGAGECGKSTVLKMFRMWHTDGFDKADRVFFRELVRRNTLNAMRSVCHACFGLGVELDSKDNEESARELLAMDQYSEYALEEGAVHVAEVPLEVAPVITRLLDDAGIQRVVKRGNEYSLLDSAEYFWSKIDDIFAPRYRPNDDDILRARKPTVGVVELPFQVENTNFIAVDVGGQRNERRKWIHAFADVNAIMFVASLSEYDQTLIEDHRQNRLAESLNLFAGTLSLPWFQRMPVILFLNKKDIFDRKIHEHPLQDYFPDFQPTPDAEPEQVAHESMAWIRRQYEDRGTQDKIYVHITTATDKKNFLFVWKATRSIILTSRLTSAGLMMC